MNKLSNSFSVSRIALMWQYYSRWIYIQAIIYAAITVLVYLVSLWASESEIFFLLLGSTGQSLLGILFYLGTIIFAIPVNRQAEIMLPSSVAEKSTFYLGYAFVAVPLFLLALWALCNGIGSIFSPNGNVQTLYNGMLSEITQSSGMPVASPLLRFNNIVSAMLIASGTLFAVLTAHRQRLLLGIAGAAAAYFVETIITLAALAIALVPVFREVVANPAVASNLNEEVPAKILSSLPYTSVITAAIVVILAIFTVRTLRRRTA